MRIRSCVESLGLRRAAPCDASGGTARTLRASVAPCTQRDPSTRRAICKAAAFAALVIATLLTIDAFVVADDDPAIANHTSATPPDCSARYAALLDLAELARRDGKSSEVVVRGLSERGGAMSDCLPIAGGGTTPR
ncbi:hypothetical protein [Paraburkholderia sp.]|uniref:hypothetical protein n=1 Tax=Paraburkholderia sp. TaxID=1926495 RepID=UPI002F403BBD